MKLTNLDVSKKYSNKIFLFSLNDFVSMFSYWVVQQHPYSFEVLNDSVKAYSKYIQKNVEFGKLGFAGLSLKDLSNINNEARLFDVKEIAQLNKPKKESDETIHFVSRYIGIKPEFDFVDIGALASNINYTMVKLAILDGNND